MSIGSIRGVLTQLQKMKDNNEISDVDYVESRRRILERWNVGSNFETNVIDKAIKHAEEIPPPEFIWQPLNATREDIEKLLARMAVISEFRVFPDGDATSTKLRFHPDGSDPRSSDFSSFDDITSESEVGGYSDGDGDDGGYAPVKQRDYYSIDRIMKDSRRDVRHELENDVRAAVAEWRAVRKWPPFTTGKIAVISYKVDRTKVFVLQQGIEHFKGALPFVFARLPLHDLFRCRRVCQVWRQAATETIRNRQTISVDPGCELAVRHTKLEAVLAHVRHVISLDLGRCANVTHVDCLARVLTLVNLSLHHCSQIPTISPLGTLHRLRALDLRGCSSLTSLAPLCSMKDLQKLDIGKCHLIASLAPLRGLAQLSHLAAPHCQGITDFAPLMGLANLTYLDLTSCNVADLAFCEFLANLDSLRVRECRQLANIWGVANHRRLRVLDVSRCPTVQSYAPLMSLTALETLGVDLALVAPNEQSAIRNVLARLPTAAGASTTSHLTDRSAARHDRSSVHKQSAHEWPRK